MGQTINIVYEPRLFDYDDSHGLAVFRENLIKILPKTESHPRTEDAIEATFYHELIHWILYMMGEDELKSNEKFIDNFSGLLHQFYKTAKY